MTSTRTLIIPGDPIPKARARTTSRGSYTPARTREAEARVRLFGRQHFGSTPIAGSIRVEVSFFRQTRRRADIDNLAKTVLDGLNGLAWIDDSQVTVLVASKHHDPDRPRTEVTITEEKPA